MRNSALEIVESSENGMGKVIPVRHAATDERLVCILQLIQTSFEYMNDRIDPPSSMLRLKLRDIASQCETGEVWSIGDPIYACMFLTPGDTSLYLGKLAVARSARRGGIARTLVNLAEERAKLSGKEYLELQTRIELTENHSAFARLGFVKTSEGSHSGYERATFITMRKYL